MNGNHQNPDQRELDEAQLTAHALGQLDQREQAAVEAKLARDAAARELVDQTGALADHVQAAGRFGPSAKPSPALREAVQRRLGTPARPSTRVRSSRYRIRRLVAVAAGLLIAAIPLYLAATSQQARQSELAQNWSPTSTPPAGSTEGIAESSDQQPATVTYRPAITTTGKAHVPRIVTIRESSGIVVSDLYENGNGQKALVGMQSPGVFSADTSIPSEQSRLALSEPKQRIQLTGRARSDAYGLTADIARSRNVGGDRHGGMIAGTTHTPSKDGMPVVVNRRVTPPGPASAHVPKVTFSAGSKGSISKVESLQGLAGGGLILKGKKEDLERLSSLSLGDVVESGVTHELPVRQYTHYAKLIRDGYGVNKPTRETLTEAPGTEQYEPIVENAFLSARQQPLSTFSIDVDTASYANVRRFLRDGRLPPPAAVRVEEMVNYFKYDYPLPQRDVPFSVNMELAGCPWNTEHRLLRIGIKGREIERDQRGPSNLVFLLDVSGSMSDGNKLPLVKQAMAMLVEQLGEDDRVAIVTYAGDAGVKLESTGGHERETILAAINSLSSGGSTHGSAGIQLAYDRATSHFIDGGTNRVILATDGDLNVGITDDDQLVKLIQDKAKTGVFLTVLGFGTGNLKDAKLEKLADKGNGIYAYIDSLREARKVLMEQLTGSLMTIAKDVKLQLEFNPAEVKQYRLIGYENRTMAAADFHNDKKDAGEIGAGHTVTALYEIVPADGQASSGAGGEGLKYQTQPEKPLSEAAGNGELLTLKLRYKLPEATESTLLERTLEDSEKAFAEASPDLRFASAVASFGMVLRGSKYCGEVSLSAVEEFAAGAIGDDPGGYRTEFLDLVRRAKELRGR